MATRAERTVALDVETTGIVVERDRVYEIGMVTLDASGEVLERYETLIRPEGLELSDRLAPHLADAPTFGDVVGDIIERLRRGVVVAHAAVFDLSMLDAELGRLGAGLPEVPYLCTSVKALGLHVDSPNRRLGMLCHVLGVEMATWHTALGDAETTARLLDRLLEIATERGLLEQVLRPQIYPGRATGWPALPQGGPVLVRDPVVFPPVGDQPEAIDPLAAAAPPSVEIPIPAELTERWGQAVALLKERRRAEQGDAVADAWEEWEAGDFRGTAGVERLQAILTTLLEAGDTESWQVALAMAQLMRYEPACRDKDTAAIYDVAMTIAAKVNPEERADAKSDVLSEWADFLTIRQDIDGLVELIEWAGTDKDLLDYLTPSGLVHRMRTAGQAEAMLGASEKLSAALGTAGSLEEAGNVCAEWAQALAEENRVAEALGVCDAAWSSGWASRNLANRHGLMLERQRDWPAVLEVCDRGLALALGDEQIAKRRARCLKNL